MKEAVKEKPTLTERIRNLNKGEQFNLNSETERQAACRIVKTLRDVGGLKCEIITRRIGKQFIVFGT